MDESRPENFKLASAVIVASEVSRETEGLPVGALSGKLGGSICPGRTALLVIVLGVANLEILKVLTLGVALKRELLFLDLVGEPASSTLVGDCGRLAGDWSSEALNGEFAGADLGAGSDGLNGDCNIEPPRGTLCGDAFIDSLNGDCGGRRAGLPITDPLKS